MKLFDSKIADIWVTMGPVLENPETLFKIFESGAKGVRVALSYGDHEIWSRRSKLIRDSAKKAGKSCLVIADTSGGKIRLGGLGDFNHLDIRGGERIKLVPLSSGFRFEGKEIPVNVDLKGVVFEGDRVMIGDGAVILKVVGAENDSVTCVVEKGGTINPNRGLIIQSEKFQPECLTEKDVEDIRYVASSEDFDALALSFVSESDQVDKAKRMLSEAGRDIPVIAKIETKKAIENLSSISEVADAIMIARGDLALFAPWTQLGNLVEKAVRTVKRSGKPWVIGTQVAEGLERFAFPTRAEICDLDRWVKEGASAILLSYETAFGPRPVDAVSCVRQLIEASSKGSQ